MTFRTLLFRNLAFYWRTNLAVVLGVAVAVSVLAGALVVGQSVRASLRELALNRLGRATHLIAATGFFRDELAKAIASDESAARLPRGRDAVLAAPIIALSGAASHETSGRRATDVAMYGVDERFWALQGRSDLGGPTAAREVWLSDSLARDLGAAQDDTILLRVQMPSAIPLESLHAGKEDIGRTVRVRVSRVLGSADLGEFSAQSQQGAVHAVFLPLARLQRDLEQPSRVNAIVVASSAPDDRMDQDALEELGHALQRHVTVEDLNLTVRALPDRGQLALESGAGYLPDVIVAAAGKVADTMSLRVTPVLTYLANRLERTATETPPRGGSVRRRAIRAAPRPVPYSLIAATDLSQITGGPVVSAGDRPPIVLNEWAAREMAAQVGDTISVEYFLWTDAGALETRTATFAVAAIVPLSGAARDPDLAPGTGHHRNGECRRLGSAVPRRSREGPSRRRSVLGRTPRDAEGIHSAGGRTAPLAIEIRPRHVAADDAGAGRAAGGHGRRLSLRARRGHASSRRRLFAAACPGRSAGRVGRRHRLRRVLPVLQLLPAGLGAAAGRAAVPARPRAARQEVGLLQALGVPVTMVRRLFLAEGSLLSALGAAMGIAGTMGYAGVIMFGLRTWWLDAVGTTALALRPSAVAVGLGVAGGLLASIGCIWWTLRTAVRVLRARCLADPGSMRAKARGARDPAAAGCRPWQPRSVPAWAWRSRCSPPPAS